MVLIIVILYSVEVIILKRIIVATRNSGKILEIREIFKDYEVLSIEDIEKELSTYIVINEDKDTFRANALEKVRCLYDSVGEDFICMADDSGLEIDYLNGFPGVKTARWMKGTDEERNRAIIKKMEGVSDRVCHYTTCIGVKGKDFEMVFSDTLDGVIGKCSRGSQGFGFDPIFFVGDKSLAELSMEEKLMISPRRKALEQALNFLESRVE